MKASVVLLGPFGEEVGWVVGVCDVADDDVIDATDDKFDLEDAFTRERRHTAQRLPVYVMLTLEYLVFRWSERGMFPCAIRRRASLSPPGLSA